MCDIDIIGAIEDIDLFDGVPEVDFFDIDIVDTVETQVYYIGKAFKSIDIYPFDKGDVLEVDLIGTAETIGQAIEKDPFGTLGTVVLTLAGAPPWAFGVNAGASAAYQGGDAEDIVKAMLKSYVGGQVGDVAANQTGNILQNAGVPESIIGIVEQGTEQFATTLIHTEGDLEAASNAFLTGSVTEGMGIVLGEIDDQLGNVLTEIDGDVKQWTDLGAGIRDGVTAGLTAAIEGDDIGEEALNSLITTYTKGIIAPIVGVSEELDIDLDDPRIRVFAQGLSTSMNAAISGGMEPTDAFFASLNAQAAEKFKDYINSPEGLGINQKLDTFFGNQKAVQDQLATLMGLQAKQGESALAYNAILSEEERLYKLYTDAVDLYNSTKGAQGKNYAALGQAFQDYVADNKDQKAAYLAAYNAGQVTIDDLEATFIAASEILLSDVEQLPEIFETFQILNDEIVATTLAMETALNKEPGPKFNKELYAEAYGLASEEEVYDHYFKNQGLAIESDLKRALADMHGNLVQRVLGANGIDFAYLNDEQRKAAFDYIEEAVPSFNSITGPDDLIRLSDSILPEIEKRSSAINPEINQAVLNPDNYVFDEGVTLRDAMLGNAVTMPVKFADGTTKLRWTFTEVADNYAEATQKAINKIAESKGVQPFAVLDARSRPIDETIAEIVRLADLGYDVSTVYAAEGNKFDLLNAIKRRVSEVEGTSDAGGYDRLLGNQEDNFGVTLTDMTVAEVLAFQKARGPGSYAEYSQGVNEARGLFRDDGTGVISTPAGKYQIVGSTLQGLVDAGVVGLNDTFDEATQEKLGTYLIEQRGLFDGDITTAQFIENLGNEFQGIALKGLGPELTVAALDRTAIINNYKNIPYVDVETLPLKMEDVQRLYADTQIAASVILEMDEQTGADFDAKTGSNAYQSLTKLANIFGLEGSETGAKNFEEFSEVIGNVASVITGSYGEVSNIIGIALEYGGAEEASEFMKEASKDLLTFSNSAKSDEWQDQNIENSERYDNLVAEWEEANPGKELTTAQKGLLKAEAIFTNIQDAPVQWVAENIGGEILQEGVNIAVGFAAKKGTSVALEGVKKSDLIDVGDRLTDIIENTAGVSGAVAVDIGEAYFGTVEGAYDKAYAEAIKMDFSEEAAEDYASELAIKNATVAAVLATISAGTGGAALAKSIFNPNKSEITNRAIDGLAVTLKESATEGLEEGITAAHLGSSLVQINPDYDAAVDVVEAGLLGTLIGGGTAGGIYTGDYMVDSLIRTNKDVQNALNSEDPIVARDTLVNLGVTDVDSLNTMLNTAYDDVVVTEYEVQTELDAQFPNVDFSEELVQGAIDNLSGIQLNSDAATLVASYVDPYYLDTQEVINTAAAEGVTLTEEQAAKYVGKVENDEAVMAGIAAEYDPQGTTYDEANQILLDLGYDVSTLYPFGESWTATSDNRQWRERIINKFTTGAEAEMRALAEGFVDSRQVTEDEVRKYFLSNKTSYFGDGYTPTDEEIAQFVGVGTNLGFSHDTMQNIAAYVDPRQTTEAEVRAAFEAAGFTPTDEQVAQFVGQLDQATQETAIGQFVDPRQTTEAEVRTAFEAAGFTPTDEQVAQFVGQLDQTAQETAIGQFVDPRQTTEAEVRSAFAALGFTPTDEQVTQFVGQLDQATQETAIGQFVDPRQTTEAEVRTAFEALGFTPTDQQVAQFVGQLDQAAQETKVGQFVDPRQTTEAEVRAAFEAAGFTPTDEQVAQFVGQLDQATQETAIGQFVDPRQTTEAEVRTAFEAAGFTPTDEQVAQFVGQLDQTAQETAIGQFVDPRQTTEAEVRAAFEAAGFTPTDEQVAQFVGQLDQATQETAIGQFVDPRQTTEAEVRTAFEALGFTPTDQQVAQFVGQLDQAAQETKVGQFVDPRQVTAGEARQFFVDLGYTPTDEQVAAFVAQVSETEQAAAIASYVDPRQVTFAEVQAIADQEGLTLTEALAATYVGQGVAANYQTEKLSEARAEYDPLATTLAEATQFFANTGYNATPEEIAQFVASKTEETQASAIGAYVDPRQVTVAEAEAFLSAIGYQPSQADIAQFTGQLNNINYQVTQKAAIDAYVDPRFFSASEVRAAYEELGLVDVTQGDVDKFVGQFDPESKDYDAAGFEAYQREQLQTYLPTATFNLISKTIGSPSVADDPNTPENESKEATGIYKAIEEGSAKDVALQEAIDALSRDLGLTETEVLNQLGTTKTDLEKSIGAVETSLGEDISDLADIIGKPATDDADATGIFADIADLVASGVTRDEAIQTVANDLGTTKTDLEKAISSVETSLGEDITDIADVLGTPEILDNPNTIDVNESQDPTGLFATIKQYENAGIARDEALDLAIGDVSTALGTTQTSLLNAIGATKDDLLAIIGAPATDSTATTGIFANIDQGLGELSTSIGADIDALSTSVGADIDALSTSVGADIDAIADIIGKPAREVTQTDVDFVAELIASQEVTTEQILQYDVTGDGLLDQLDIDLLNQTLSGDTTTGLADTSIFQDATGMFGTMQDQNTALQTQLDTLTDQNTQLNTQLNTVINTQQRDERRRENEKALQAAMPRVIRESRPEKLNLDYLYDFSSIFANPSQEGLFVSPFGSTNTSPLKQASGFSRGGVVDMLTTTDKILDLLK